MLYGSALKPVCLPVLRLRHPRTMPIDILSEDFCVILARCRDLYCRLYQLTGLLDGVDYMSEGRIFVLINQARDCSRMYKGTYVY